MMNELLWKEKQFLCEILTQFSHVYMNPHTEFTTYNLKYKCRQEEVFIMTEHNKNENKSNQLTLSAQVRELVQSGLYDDCYKVIVDEMKNSPHAPEPHNSWECFGTARRSSVSHEAL